jgi:thiosulfate/3-mercaptopyruvate sulfurtransferase
MLVTTEWLAAHARDANLVVLHVGRRAQYDSGHMDGARFVALSDISTPPGPGKLTLQMPPVEELTAWAQSQGISDRSRIVVVPHDDTLQSAARVFLTLAYLGAMDRTSLLDGGFKAWRAENRVVTTALPPAPRAARFTARPRPELIATIDQVEAATKDGKVAIVDARLARFYEGNGGGYPRPGHIPTAVNIPLNTVSTATGHLRAPTELRQLFLDAGVREGKPVVTYCHIGQQASLLWFVATLLGYDARMFDGSFQEWSGTERLPVEMKK